MDEAETVVLDYSSDRLITDGHFQQSILSSIARSGCEIEELFGSAQDIEGVVRDGKIYVVQTRPQMWGCSSLSFLFFPDWEAIDKSIISMKKIKKKL